MRLTHIIEIILYLNWLYILITLTISSEWHLGKHLTITVYRCILIYVYIIGNIILYSIVWKYNSNLTAPWLQKSVSLVQVKTCNRKFFSFFVNAKTFLSIYILICPLFISLRIYFPIFPYHLENFYMEWLGLLGKVTWHEFFYG